MMVDHTLAPEQRGFPTEEYEHLYKLREPSGRVRVWMSSYVGEMPASGRLYGLDVDVSLGDGAGSHAGVSQPPERGWRDVYGATISFGPVVFQVFGTRVAALLDGWSILNPHPIVFPLWPYRESFTWTPTAGFDDHGLKQFADVILGHVQRKAGRTAAR
jgi:hypothetical protein